MKKLENRIFTVNDEAAFESLALEIFQIQYKNCITYKRYVDFLGINVKNITQLTQIPFLPIEFYKNHIILHKDYNETIIFFSSGTTGVTQSKHYVANQQLYQQSFIKTFEAFYGAIENYCFLALLPDYLEREGSSLIYMVNNLMKISNHPQNGFYLNEYKELEESVRVLKENGEKYMVFGVTYALLDFAEQYKVDLSDGIVMVTGGMKGKRKELTTKEVDSLLKNSFSLKQVHSEYGMTELLSQAYSNGDGLFSTPNWMKVLIRDTYDPFSYQPDGKSGGINVIDLANLYSCSFIETKDLGRKNKNGQFEVLGRFDNSDIRGCNLLVS
jgi:phenylacetate-coenzyme A ligase PaaK-like adenylate-forming protein